MKNKTLVTAGISVAVLLIVAMMYKKMSVKKDNSLLSETEVEVDYESADYLASLQHKIEVAMGMHDKPTEKDITNIGEVPIIEQTFVADPRFSTDKFGGLLG